LSNLAEIVYNASLECPEQHLPLIPPKKVFALTCGAEFDNPLLRMKNLIQLRFVTATFMATVISITSCAESTDGRTTQLQGTALGAGAGGLLGAIAGNQMGSSGTGALIGAGLGGLGGFAYGTHVANQKNKYKTTEAWLDACIADANRKHQDAVAYNRKLDQRIASLKNEIRLAKANQERTKLSALKREIAAEEAKAEKQAAELKKEVDLHARAASEAPKSSKTSALRSKSAELDTARRVTGQRRQVLAQLRTSTGV